MKKYLVIGNPIEHSLSPLIHNYWMRKHGLTDSVYEKKKVEKKDLENIVNQVRNNELKGVNVTVPFKKEIIPFLDKIDDIAKSTNSVNTFFKFKNEIWGYNTDAKGFENSLTLNNIIDYRGKDILILGAGGVTASVLYNFINVVNKIYIALDRDAIKQALNFCEKLMAEGKEVYLVDLQDKDPSEMGFENFTKLIQQTVPLTYYNLMEQKLSI